MLNSENQGGRSPRIIPTVHHLDRRRSHLGFTIDPAGAPLYEVVLCTDPQLFDPSNAGRRSVGNFYASRQDGGLSHSEGPLSRYLVPAAALEALSSGGSGSRSIYYALATYAGLGAAPTWASPPESLRVDAPSVSVSQEFRGRSLGDVRIRTSRRDSVGALGSAGPSNGATENSRAVPEVATPVAAQPVAPLVRREQDEIEGEDGYTWRAARQPTEVRTPASNGSVPSTGSESFAYEDGWDGPTQPDTYAAASWVTGATESPPAAVPFVRHDPPAANDASDGYDGFDDYDDEFDDWGDTPYRQLAEPAPELFPAAPAAAPSPRVPLTDEMKRHIIEVVALHESGSDRYAAINADGEFAGRFPGHPAEGRWHVGLSFGLVQFTQDSGSLGQLLALMQQRDSAAFDAVFGPSSAVLLSVTNTPGPGASQAPDGRGLRVQPVDGSDLWEEPWLSRFRQAGTVPTFQAAQNQLASGLYLEPMLEFARWFGLDTERAVAIVVDRAIQMGVSGAKHWVANAVGRLASAQVQQDALAQLGFAAIRDFQAANPPLVVDGSFGPMTHAALTNALRQANPASALVPTLEQMLDAMERRADGEPWARRVSRLRSRTESPDLSDEGLQF